MVVVRIGCTDINMIYRSALFCIGRIVMTATDKDLMNKRELELLEKVFEKEIEGAVNGHLRVYQTKAKLAAKLARRRTGLYARQNGG
jgi:hypothetical protein